MLNIVLALGFWGAYSWADKITNSTPNPTKQDKALVSFLGVFGILCAILFILVSF